MRIDDFVCLGRTVPEESKKYGHRVCMAGYPEELGQMMRVYPLPIVCPIRARHRVRMELVRNHQDSRLESWKLAERDGAILEVSSRPVPAADIIGFLEGRASSSIAELNALRRSLGVLVVPSSRGHFVARKGASHPDQLALFEHADHAFGAGAVDIAPYIEFQDVAGGWHDMQIREWGCYEWIRNHRDQAHQLWSNLGPDRGPILMVIGNMNNHRNSWLIIKTFRLEKADQMGLFEPEMNGSATT